MSVATSSIDRAKRAIGSSLTNGALLLASALMVVPFSWMLTVSLKGRRQVFSESNFLPKLAFDSSKASDMLLIILLAGAFAITAAWIIGRRRGRAISLVLACLGSIAWAALVQCVLCQ